MNPYEIYCSSCNCKLSIDEVHYMSDQAFCAECFEELTTVCYDCGTRILCSESVGGDAERPLCEQCYDDYYTNCDECGRLVYQEYIHYDAYNRTLCDHCMKEGPIYNYAFKPTPIFYGEESTLFLGVELELDNGGCDRENASDLTKIANADASHIYIKTDGSLDEGFEIVTHPMTLQYHMEKMPWQDLTREALHLGYRSHKAGTCGLHCHVNRSFFGTNKHQQEENIANVLFLVEKYWDELLRFSRRTQGQMDHWAARYGFKEKPGQVLDHAKNSSIGRYACINLQNHQTIEFRMWRGTLKYNTLIATLQMVARLCKVAIFHSEKELQNLSWWRFVFDITEPELITYLKERRLYLNEPVETEEEE